MALATIERASYPRSFSLSEAQQVWQYGADIILTRQSENSELIKAMIDIRERYNGDWVVPYASAQEPGSEMPPVTPALLSEAIDWLGGRAGSVLPKIHCPAVRGHQEKGAGSRQWARIRSRALAHMYSENHMNLVLRRWFKHLSGYGTATLICEPDFMTGIPRIRTRDPLTVYPDPRSMDDFDPPQNIAFINGKSASFLRKRFPFLRQEKGGPITAPGKAGFSSNEGDEIWDVGEYIDDNIMVMGLLGPRNDTWQGTVNAENQSRVIGVWENEYGFVPAVTGGRVTLDRMVSTLKHVLGHTDLMARLQYLDILATEKAIYPDTFVISAEGRTATLVNKSGKWNDGRSGEINILEDATEVNQLRNTPDPTNKQSIDRIERNIRSSIGLIPAAGGETYGALRTGKGIDSLMGAAVDHRMQEMHEVTQAWLPQMNRALFRCAEVYWPDTKFYAYSNWPGEAGEVEYIPGKHFGESYASSVSYPIAGADVQETNIAVGQLVQTEMLSRNTAREMHPWIKDPDGEAQRIDEEMLESAARQTILQGSLSQQIPVEFLDKIQKFRKKDGYDILSAITAATKEIQRERVEEAPPPDEGLTGPPEAELGLQGGPVQQAPAQELSTGVGPTAGLEDLRELMNAQAASNRHIRVS
ncbi:MAG: hypothetical protein GY701_22945 [Sulfitobacter sp.]|nr:hypothetical protein [Sulfitobacter sp.]